MDDAERSATAAANRRTMAYLVGGFLVWMFGAQLTRSSQVEVLLNHFRGDTVALAAAMGRAGTLSALVGILINPIVGSAADAFGRRAVLLAGAVFSILRPAAWLVAPGVTGLMVAETLAPIAQVCAILPAQAAIGDMYGHDRVKLASNQSLLFLVPAVCQIVCPMGGAALTSWRLLAPFVIGVVTAALSGLVALGMPEPMPADQRRPFRWLHSTPFTAFSLFRKGRYMASLSVIQVLMDFSETAGRPDRGAAALVELHQKELGWEVRLSCSLWPECTGLGLTGRVVVARS